MNRNLAPPLHFDVIEGSLSLEAGVAPWLDSLNMSGICVPLILARSKDCLCEAALNIPWRRFPRSCIGATHPSILVSAL